MIVSLDLASGLPTKFLEYLDLQASLVIARSGDSPVTAAVFEAVHAATAAEVRRRALSALARPVTVPVDLDADLDPERLQDGLSAAIRAVQTCRDSLGSPDRVALVWAELLGQLIEERSARRRRRGEEDVALRAMNGVRVA